MTRIPGRRGRAALLALLTALIAAYCVAVISDRSAQADVWLGGFGGSPNVVLQTGGCGDPGAIRENVGQTRRFGIASYVWVCPGGR